MGNRRVTILMLDGEADIVEAVVSFATKLGIVSAVESESQDSPTPKPRRVYEPARFVPGERVEAIHGSSGYSVTAGRHGTVVDVNVPRKGSVLVRWDGEEHARNCRGSLLRSFTPSR